MVNSIGSLFLVLKTGSAIEVGSCRWKLTSSGISEAFLEDEAGSTIRLRRNEPTWLTDHTCVTYRPARDPGSTTGRNRRRFKFHGPERISRVPDPSESEEG